MGARHAPRTQHGVRIPGCPHPQQWNLGTPAGLPDPDDAHVIAAAVLGGAGAIVTDNIKDFPGDLLPPNIDVVTPAAFIADSVGIDCSVARAALIEMLNRRRNPPMSFHALLATLEERYQLQEACELLRSADTET